MLEGVEQLGQELDPESGQGLVILSVRASLWRDKRWATGFRSQSPVYASDITYCTLYSASQDA